MGVGGGAAEAGRGPLPYTCRVPGRQSGHHRQPGSVLDISFLLLPWCAKKKTGVRDNGDALYRYFANLSARAAYCTILPSKIRCDRGRGSEAQHSELLILYSPADQAATSMIVLAALLADSDYLAEATAAFLMHDDTEPPLTIDICGRWGTGAPNELTS